MQTDLNLCSKPDRNDVWSIIQYFQGPWGYLAMGNYPYPSNYILPSHAASLPAWPLNATCSAILDGSFPRGYLIARQTLLMRSL